MPCSRTEKGPGRRGNSRWFPGLGVKLRSQGGSFLSQWDRGVPKIDMGKMLDMVLRYFQKSFEVFPEELGICSLSPYDGQLCDLDTVRAKRGGVAGPRGGWGQT